MCFCSFGEDKALLREQLAAFFLVGEWEQFVGSHFYTFLSLIATISFFIAHFSLSRNGGPSPDLVSLALGRHNILALSLC